MDRMFGLSQDDAMRLLYLALLLVFLVGTGIGWRRTRPGSPISRFGAGFNFQHLGIWIAIALGLVTLYAYRAPLQRFAAPILQELDPGRVVEVTDADGAQGLSIARGRDGHFHIEAEANGTPVSFLVDTGASATVLTLKDAERAGIDVAALEFNRPVQTANGVALFAHADLRTLQIGPYRLNALNVGVMPEGAMETSLLGMNTIDRFNGWRIEGDRMVLTP